jgi:VIT1/CCC1 family predicted Fe2+/Mn2+ transporter
MELYDSWHEEMTSAYLYQVMADNEANVLHKRLFTDLRLAALKQAATWEHKIKSQGLPPPSYQPALRTRLVAWLIRWVGSQNLHHILSAMKVRGMSVFTHYNIERKHTSLSSASNLRAGVFGISDGLVSNVSLILGIAGAQADQHFIILAGVAGLLAGACSMAAGEYISVRTQREVFEYQIEIEKQELEEYTEEEMEELTLIYKARGVPDKQATELARIMIENPETGLNTLAREELGINPEDMVSPIGAMISSFVAFGLGAAVPLLPFLFSHSSWNLFYSIGLTGATLFATGTIMSLFSNRNPILLGLRMLSVGVIAGTLTYFIGQSLGVALH